MSYREHPAPPALEPWLACLWERTAEPHEPVRVLPDGCIDIVFIDGVGTQLVGANTRAFVVELAPGTRVVGARMLPGCAPALLGIAAESVRDLRMPVSDVLVRGAWLDQALAAAHDPLGMLRHELERLAGGAPLPDRLVRAAVSRLGVPGLAIAGLADELGISERTLRRRVTAAVGYGPRRLARVFRLAHAVQSAQAGGELARVAADAGYTDQAHFTHDCRELAGVTPSVLLGG